MRVLFATLSDRSQPLPTVPLAPALSAAGHEVLVAGSPALVDAVKSTGPLSVAVGADHDFAHARPLCGFGNRSARRDAFPHRRAARPAGRRADPMEHWLGAHLHRRGADFDEEIVVGQWSIDQISAGLHIPLTVERTPVRYLPSNEPCEIPTRPPEAPRRPGVALSPGLTAHATLGCGAFRVADRGAGPGDPTADVLREGVRRLVHEPSFRTRAERARAENLATPSAHDLVPVLERRTAERTR
ncbi:hypothetical protein ACIQ7D_35405 [Streptomyces sp. NPDC096310]|uniref:hypothetical protein n=1 Tax=Streptomyces sp. NPDC096310 TaxID=3366082 RepID=UPI003808B53C